MRLFLAKSLSLSLVAFIAGCSCDSSSPFGKASRTTSLDGVLRDSATATTSRVYVIQSETQTDPYPRSLNVDIEDPSQSIRSPFSGHILHLRLLDPQSHVIQEIVTMEGPSYAKSILTETVFFTTNAEHARFDAIRDLLLKGGIVVEIETDLPGRERIHVPLTLGEATGWAKSSCD